MRRRLNVAPALLSTRALRSASQRLSLRSSTREAECLTGKRHKIVSDLHQAYQDIWTNTFREGEKKGIFRPLPAVAIKGILGMYFYSFLWLKPTGKSSSREIADIFAEMALSAAKYSNGR